MKRIFFTKVVLVILTIAVLGFGLAGCVTISPTTPPIEPPFEPTTGTIQLVVSGTYTYDLTMDGITRFSNKQPGTYTLYNVPTGNHSFEAIDTWGSDVGYDSEIKYISAGSNYVYLSPYYPY